MTGHELKGILREKFKTQREFAVKAKMAENILSNLLRCERIPDAYLLRIQRALDAKDRERGKEGQEHE